METRKKPLEPNKFYHIYNRGINGQNIFLEERNYSYFLEKYTKYVHPYFETYAYCLLKNHFHILVKAHNENEIREILNGKKQNLTTSWHLSNVFSSLFKSYAQAINKSYQRTGGLFEEPFHRIEIDNDAYFSQVIKYIHQNPQKHGFVLDFREYPHSSYRSNLHLKPTKLQKEKVLQLFDGGGKYEESHLEIVKQNQIQKYIIEFD